MRGPGITVTCECDAVQVLPYGASWECGRCGRKWNTGQIPEADYRAFARALRRYEVESIVFPVVLAAIFAPLIVFVDVRLGITGLLVFFAWAFLLRPRRRRSLVARVVNGARWQLHPE